MKDRQTMPVVIDASLRTLLMPVSPEQPAGEHLKYGSLYDAIEETRRYEDLNLPQGVWEREVRNPDWKKVEALCLEGLQRSKDLQLMAWLVETWTILEGLEGLERGLTWMLDFSQTFWTNAYPLLEEEDVSLRVAPFLWLDVRLPQVLSTLAISLPRQKNVRAFRMADWLTAQRLEVVSRKHEDREGYLKQEIEENGGVSLFLLWQSISVTPVAFYEQFQTHCEACLQRLRSLESFLNQALSPYHEEPVSFFKLTQQLTQLLTWCTQWKLKASAPPPQLTQFLQESVATIPVSDVKDNVNSDLPQPVATSFQTRETLIDTLETAYDTLKSQDPHGLLFLFLEQALIWKDHHLLELFKHFEENEEIFNCIVKFLSKNKYK